MGVAGSGKTTLGSLLARRLGYAFHEGDEYHSPASIEKMASGIPLEDADRWPWLERIRSAMRERCGRGEGAVFACSALRQSYRRFLRDGVDGIRFVYLKADPGTLRARLESREGHYMSAAMLDSQLESLEEPDDAIEVDVRDTPERAVARIRSALGGAHDDR